MKLTAIQPRSNYTEPSKLGLAGDLRRWRRLNHADRVTLFRATAALMRASLEIKLTPFRKVVGAAARSLVAPEPAAHQRDATIARTVWAVDALARRLPWRIVCFQKGLAAHRLLRRSGIDTRLHYGVRQSVEEGLKAHVWLSHRGLSILGGAEAKDYTCLAVFPDDLTPATAPAR